MVLNDLFIYLVRSNRVLDKREQIRVLYRNISNIKLIKLKGNGQSPLNEWPEISGYEHICVKLQTKLPRAIRKPGSINIRQWAKMN